MNDFERRALDIAQSSTYLTIFARQGQAIQGIEYFAYAAEIDNLSPANTDTATFQVLSDSDFVCTYLTGAAVNPTTGLIDAVPQATLQITDTGSGKTFFNQPTFMGLVVGQGGYPFLLPAPRLIAPNTNIQYQVKNLLAAGGGNARTYYLTMMGARIYYGGNGG